MQIAKDFGQRSPAFATNSRSGASIAGGSGYVDIVVALHGLLVQQSENPDTGLFLMQLAACPYRSNETVWPWFD